MNNKVIVFVLIVLCALFIGFETVAKAMSLTTHNIGYVLGLLLFLLALVYGSKNRS
ncbi:hypothetical protein [Brevibacillus fulvus]|uniref:Uncharacterized membrane protein YtjA (UPF0391 family) n=1 Tax=Brevibacillus fulvus TaxID=1125967 RepID=A0A938XWT4_9BACL|nr:hypothetical protein [Brevibacillus fulvus]MBM7591637.1 uncharacterized membrane protein YtjA (UPF0391 family) [Brevibacillus fulvus]